MIRQYLGDSVDLFSVIGAGVTVFVAFKVAISLFRFITTHFLASTLGLPANLKNAGSWAVITGCTDGIGKAYAEQLAAKGLNVVLISRTLSKLEDMAKEVESKYKVETKVIAADFSREDIYDGIKLKMNGLDIGVLVNNVGCSYEYPEYFGEVEEADFSQKMIHMNCTSVAMMTEIVLPAMVAKKRGYVINIGSSAGFKPAPLLALYSGTKGYVEMFTRSLYHEYIGRGVTFQYVAPYFVVSKLSKFRRTSLMVPSPNAFVRNALKTVGVQAYTTGYWAHDVQRFVHSFMPASMSMSMMQGARKKALKKKAAAKSQ
ncbi:very-long-chain 3-oxoacyl-CoA reductase [Aplysia californica]|uniref:Very-long-chain 3-oxoacyl-CoA reductase n=1 Tax=Aplysia californica TaxID=6500 RepID=A0ABM0JCA2_APLCA|nr:very-long-chain 3-oxoacyl-CoA reductase [Aplysia californica]